MGLVDYSDSESESEAVKPLKASAQASQSSSSKKPFQKIVDRSNPGKILVSIPSAAATPGDPEPNDEPAPKRLKTAGGGGRFSAFGSFLPAPKAISKVATVQNGSGTATPRIGVHLKTSSEAAFSREKLAEDEEDDGTNPAGGAELKLPPAKAQAQPSIPENMKPADEVKLVGKPLMFKPLSVARKPGKKSGSKPASAKAVPPASNPAATMAQVPRKAEETSRKKISLFSIADDSTKDEPTTEDHETYEPLYPEYDSAADFPSAYGDQQPYEPDHDPSLPQPQAQPVSQSQSLDAIADDLNLSAAARRELFGRGGHAGKSATKVVNFNMDAEYAHNEALRAAGDAQPEHKPVRAIAPGKHSLRQLVNAVQNQRDALEESFVKNRSTQKEAAGRYGWK